MSCGRRWTPPPPEGEGTCNLLLPPGEGWVGGILPDGPKRGRAKIRCPWRICRRFQTGRFRKRCWRRYAGLDAFARKFFQADQKRGRAKLLDPWRICPNILPDGAGFDAGADTRALAHLSENSSRQARFSLRRILKRVRENTRALAQLPENSPRRAGNGGWRN